MGYSTEFFGAIRITPFVSSELKNYINKFCNTRHMIRDTKQIRKKYKGEFGYNNKYGIQGEFFVGNDYIGVLNRNEPPKTQPGLNCDWEITQDGQYIQWSGMEKFYDAPEWMYYIINKFLAPNGYLCEGSIFAQGDYIDDKWELIVANNKVYRIDIE